MLYFGVPIFALLVIVAGATAFGLRDKLLIPLKLCALALAAYGIALGLVTLIGIDNLLAGRVGLAVGYSASMYFIKKHVDRRLGPEGNELV